MMRVEAGIKKLDDGSFIVPEDMDLDDFLRAVFINTETEASRTDGLRADWKDSRRRIPIDLKTCSEEEDLKKDKEIKATSCRSHNS